jgi:hypothetical protein
VANPPAGYGATQDGCDVVLYQEIGKALGAISASEGDRHEP